MGGCIGSPKIRTAAAAPVKGHYDCMLVGAGVLMLVADDEGYRCARERPIIGDAARRRAALPPIGRSRYLLFSAHPRVLGQP